MSSLGERASQALRFDELEGRFDADRMVDDYLALYRWVVALHRAEQFGERVVR